MANEVLVAGHVRWLTGFPALRIASPSGADGTLFGVTLGAQDRDVFASLVAQFLAWNARRGVLAATQRANVLSQMVVVRARFDADASFLRYGTFP